MAFVYMPALQEAVLFGGRGANADLGDTWTWRSGCWTPVTPQTSPPTRVASAAVYDAATGVALMYDGAGQMGGAGPIVLTTDTWAWDGVNWKQVATSGPNVAGVAGTDPVTGHVLLFGLARNGGAPETWRWDGAKWQQLSPAHTPPGLSAPTLAVDPVNNRLLLFGGQVYGQGGKNDTWTWSGTDWVLLAPATRPPARFRATMGSWAQGRGTILIGGVGRGPLLDDAWKWDGTNWSQLASLSAPRSDAAAIDAGGQLLFFGGGGPSGRYGDFETWDGAQWTRSTLATPATSPPDPIRLTGQSCSARPSTAKARALGGYYTLRPAPRWTDTGDYVHTESLLLQLTAPTTNGYGPTRINFYAFPLDVQADFGSQATAHSIAVEDATTHNRFTSRGTITTSVSDCSVAAAAAAAFGYAVASENGYWIFVVHRNRLLGIKIVGTGGISDQALQDALGMIGSITWTF